MRLALEMSFPVSELKIEVVLVVGRRPGLRIELGCARLRSRFEFFLADAGLVGDPVDLPGLASIVGEGLFKVRGGRGDLRPDESDQDDSPFDGLLIVELSLAVLEFADGGYAENAVFAGGPIDAPLVGLGIVEPQGKALDVVGSAGGFKLFNIGTAVPQFAGDGGSVKFGPGCGAGHGMEKSF